MSLEKRTLNEALFEKLASRDPALEAVDAVNDFTRAKMRKDGFYRRIMQPVPVNLTRLVLRPSLSACEEAQS